MYIFQSTIYFKNTFYFEVWLQFNTKQAHEPHNVFIMQKHKKPKQNQKKLLK